MSLTKTVLALGALGGFSALLVTGVTADHKTLGVGTPSSSAIANRFAAFDAAAFDTRGAVNHKPLKVEKRAAYDEHSIGGLRKKMRQESPMGQAGAEWE
ncbi:hypothetical protein LTR36_009559 [Oleoguttula mirabilis]|uniref:Uncharacterized protein n=1 Tax=Oleoguttula mirabilis TaxID=1507867 RepID=A0AAV9JVN9_9PEZI|nr:hypothetical protein LTR36_009559 [Oleoguttula mirabilis]